MIVGQNIVILNETPEGHFDYYGRCPHCGYVERVGHINAYMPRNGRGGLGKRRCSKCKTEYPMYADNTR